MKNKDANSFGAVGNLINCACGAPAVFLSAGGVCACSQCAPGPTRPGDTPNKLPYVEVSVRPGARWSLHWRNGEETPLTPFRFRARGNYTGIDVASIRFDGVEQLAVAGFPIEILIALDGPNLVLPCIPPGGRIVVEVHNPEPIEKTFSLRPVSYTDVDDAERPDTIPTPAPTEPTNEPPACDLCSERMGHDAACPRSGAVDP